MPRAARSTSDEALAAARLLSAAAVRERCAELLEAGEHGHLEHWEVRSERLVACAERVAAVTRSRYPDLAIPAHSRWRHLAADGGRRWAALAGRLGGGDRCADARARIDLTVASVLLDAGAGPRWRWHDPASGALHTRSEGLALASLELFASGALGTAATPQVDAEGLDRLSAGDLARAFQAGPDNPLVGLEGRLALLHALSGALRARPDLFGDPPRPGHLLDHLAAASDDRSVRAGRLLEVLLEGLGPIWPARIGLAGRNLGDCWRHPQVRRDDPSDRLVPLHKLSQWLAWSLIEPIEASGLRVSGRDELTGLAEYRNGGLLVDLGVLVARDPTAGERRHAPGSTLVVEWRALTVALLDRLLGPVRARLGLTEEAFGLGELLEGGTWAAGRELAAERRPGAAPPLRVASDGTLF